MNKGALEHSYLLTFASDIDLVDKSSTRKKI